MNKIIWIRIIALSGALSVAMGAFAAHGLDASLSPSLMNTLRTAVLYQFLHSLALLGIICLPERHVHSDRLEWAARSFLAGIMLFSGSLYALIFTGISALGFITPLGGTAFIIGWGILFFAVKPQD
tara:strand:- start:11132 stop:11509 length:378 start_codon:yes stop_codon:yes gene_type:complete